MGENEVQDEFYIEECGNCHHLGYHHRPGCDFKPKWPNKEDACTCPAFVPKEA